MKGFLFGLSQRGRLMPQLLRFGGSMNLIFIQWDYNSLHQKLN